MANFDQQNFDTSLLEQCIGKQKCTALMDISLFGLTPELYTYG